MDVHFVALRDQNRVLSDRELDINGVFGTLGVLDQRDQGVRLDPFVQRPELADWSIVDHGQPP